MNSLNSGFIKSLVLVFFVVLNALGKFSEKIVLKNNISFDMVLGFPCSPQKFPMKFLKS
jgi:hypothetical protein